MNFKLTYIQVLVSCIQDVTAQLAITKPSEKQYDKLWGQLQAFSRLLAEEVAA